MTRLPAQLACCCLLAVLAACEPADAPGVISDHRVDAADDLLGLEFDTAERAQMLADLEEQRAAYVDLRSTALPNGVAPVLIYDPLAGIAAADRAADGPRWSAPGPSRMPAERSDLAWLSVAELGGLLRSGQITSLELTDFFLDRLERYGANLEALVTLTEALAHQQAARADADFAAGRDRGPLHGIPYAAKDLFAVPGYPTTWGAAPYRDQWFDETATVIERLEAAGAVLVAKLALGALAWGDVWFGGRTRNPWNLEQGSSGSSAGSAAAVAAGLVPYALGSETWGSIISPAERVGVTGLRPSFGTVSRSGAMSLAWSMDKVGVLCRHAEDCAMVYDAIRGPDGRDPTVRAVGFAYRPVLDISAQRIGYVARDLEAEHRGRDNDLASLELLRSLGAELVPIELPALPGVSTGSLAFLLSAEAATAFDELTRSNRDELLTRQVEDAWPNVFRAARFIPAVEYLQANRLRAELLERVNALFEQIDLYVAPATFGDNLLLTNLTGHPSVALPNGFDAAGGPTSISFVGRLADEERLLGLARAWQRATDFEEQHPQEFR